MTAVIYARYSTDSQREESIEGQIRECTAYAEKNGLTYEAYQASYDQEHAYIAALAEKEGLEFLDFNKEDTGDFSKALESYVDREGHMTGEAAGVFSRELGKKLKEN